MKTLLLFFAPLAALGLASPTPSGFEWSPGMEKFYSTVDKHVQLARQSSNFPNAPACNLANAVFPVAPTPLPSPSGLTLVEVAIGRGVQNYTCANNSASATPAPVGAIASLYNASCVAANYGDILTMLPPLALQFPVPSASSNLQPSNMDQVGEHFFETTTTPVFNLNANPDSQLGVAVCAKQANSTAPATADKGVNGVGNGAVAWLYLTTTTATTGNIKSVYRLNTAGGSPPKTCSGMPASFSVDYAAEYWFYAVP